MGKTLVCAIVCIVGCGDSRKGLSDASVTDLSESVDASVIDMIYGTSDGASDAPIDGPQQNIGGNCARNIGANHGESGGAIAADSDGSVVVLGYFAGPATFGPGETNAATFTSPQGMFLARYRPDCSLAWAREVVGPTSRGDGNNLGMGVTIAAGAIYVTGTFEGTATFGRGETLETTHTATGNHDLFVARYTPTGALVWARRATATDTLQATGIAAAGTSVYVAGWFVGDATFAPGEPSAVQLASTGSVGLFVARYDTGGTLATAWKVGDANSAFDTGGITAVPGGGVAITGGFSGTPTFGLGEPNATTLSVAGVFVARYAADNSLVWAKSAGATGATARGYGITVVADASAILVTGFFGLTSSGTSTPGRAIFGAGEANATTLTRTPSTENLPDLFVAKFAGTTGALAWAKKAGSAGWDVGFAIAATTNGGAVIAGDVGGPNGGTTTFGSGEGNQTVLTASGYDVFVARYGADGLLDWANHGASPGGYDDAYGVAVSPDGSAIATGRFGSSVPANASLTFNPSSSSAITITSAGTTDGFIARFAP